MPTEKVGVDKIVDALMVEYQEWFSRQKHWANLVVQSLTVLLGVSAIGVSVLSTSTPDIFNAGLALLAIMLLAFILIIVVPSTLVYSYFSRLSKKRLLAIELKLSSLGIDLGFQRTFDEAPVRRWLLRRKWFGRKEEGSD